VASRFLENVFNPDLNHLIIIQRPITSCCRNCNVIGENRRMTNIQYT